MILRTALICILSFTISCEKPVEVDKKLVVKVGNDKLYLEDFQELIPEDTKYEDSLEIVNHHVDNWIKETLFKLEADRKVNKSEINELVDEYRRSLLIHKYEQELTSSKLDTVIQQEELDQFYKNRKADFILTESAYLFFSFQVPESEKELILADWKGSNWENLDSLCRINNFPHRILDSLWLVSEQLYEYFPEFISEKVKMNKGAFVNYLNVSDSIRYFVQIVDRLKPGNQAPASVVKNQLEKLVLHKRRLKLLQEEKSSLYEKAISSKSVVKYSEN